MREYAADRTRGVRLPSKTFTVNLSAAVIALGAAIVLARPLRQDAPIGPAVDDAEGQPVILRHYERIVSTSLVADRLLLELCEPHRITAVSERSARTALDNHRFEGFQTIASLSDTERILSLYPDLVLTHAVSDRRAVARLRGADISVFDLGSMRGVATLRRNALVIARLVGAPERGKRLIARFERRLGRIVRHSLGQRPSALYVGLHGDKLYGGTTGTSYHDVLNAAGLSDAGASRFSGWPKYTPEQLLILDPEHIVTQEGMREPLCSRPGLHQLRACSQRRGVIELPAHVISDPGLVMLDAAEMLHSAIFENDGAHRTD